MTGYAFSVPLGLCFWHGSHDCGVCVHCSSDQVSIVFAKATSVQVCFSLGYINFLLALFHPHTLQDSLKLDCGEQRFILAKQTTKLAIYLVAFGSFAKFNPEAGEIVSLPPLELHFIYSNSYS